VLGVDGLIAAPFGPLVWRAIGVRVEVELIENDLDAGVAKLLGEEAHTLTLIVINLSVADEDFRHGDDLKRAADDATSAEDAAGTYTDHQA